MDDSFLVCVLDRMADFDEELEAGSQRQLLPSEKNRPSRARLGLPIPGSQPAADPRLDPRIDPKKARRILANRLSAAKSKLKQKVEGPDAGPGRG